MNINQGKILKHSNAYLSQVWKNYQRGKVFSASEAMRDASQASGAPSGSPGEFLHEDLRRPGQLDLINRGGQIFDDVRPHICLNGDTPAERAGIKVEGENTHVRRQAGPSPAACLLKIRSPLSA
jgi:hypothetical protein